MARTIGQLLMFTSVRVDYRKLGSPIRRKLLLYDYEGLTDFVQQHLEIQGQYGLLRINHDIRIRCLHRPRQPDSLPQAAFYTISLNGASEHTAHRESNAQTRSNRRLRSVRNFIGP